MLIPAASTPAPGFFVVVDGVGQRRHLRAGEARQLVVQQLRGLPCFRKNSPTIFIVMMISGAIEMAV